jgi:hypothetical protein
MVAAQRLSVLRTAMASEATPFFERLWRGGEPMRDLGKSQAFVVICGSLLAMTVPAAAEGAMAVGITGDVAKDGYSIGMSVDYATEEEARKGAMDWCRNHGGSPQTEAKCEVIIVFQRKCAAEAQDPDPGTPGAGWAVADDLETAKKVALTNCRASAGKKRMDFCKVVGTTCDTKP